MDSKSLAVFTMIYERKSIRQAAVELYLSPQAVSRILQNLESELCVPLFERSVKGIIPTDAGEYFYHQAVMLLKGMKQICQNVRNIYGEKHTVKIVCGYGVLSALPYQKILNFKEKYQDIEVYWREYPDKQAEYEFLNKDYEIALLVKHHTLSGTQYDICDLYSKKVVILVYEGHRLYHRDSLSYEDLKNEALIMEGDDFHIYEEFERRCNENGVYPNFVAKTGDISFCHKLCTLKQGLAVSLDFLMDDFKNEHVRAIPLEDDQLRWSVQMISNKYAALSQAAKKFCDYLKG